MCQTVSVFMLYKISQLKNITFNNHVIFSIIVLNYLFFLYRKDSADIRVLWTPLHAMQYESSSTAGWNSIPKEVAVNTAVIESGTFPSWIPADFTQTIELLWYLDKDSTKQFKLLLFCVKFLIISLSVCMPYICKYLFGLIVCAICMLYFFVGKFPIHAYAFFVCRIHLFLEVLLLWSFEK